MQPLTRIVGWVTGAGLAAVLAVSSFLVFVTPESTAVALLNLEEGTCGHELRPCLEKWLAHTFPNASPKLAGAVKLIVTPSIRPFGLTASLSVDDVELNHGRDADKVLHITAVLLRVTPVDLHASSRVSISFGVADATASFQGIVASPFADLQ